MNLNRLSYFAAVVDAGSFTGAAARLGITKAVVSQQVARLEADVGTTLLVRTTRKVRPTEAGRAFHVRCTNILREAEDAFGELGQAASVPTGTLRIAAPFDYGISRVVPASTEFTSKYPKCSVELSLGDRTVDLMSGHLDIAIRVGWLADSSLQARRIGSFRQLLVCSQQFGNAIAGLSHPGQLDGLPFVANKVLRHPLEWEFTRGDTLKEVVTWRAAISIDATMAVHAAVAGGAGLSVLPEFLVATDVAAGRLIHILPAWDLPSGSIHAVFPVARYRPSKVAAFVDVLTAGGRDKVDRRK